MAEKKRSRFGKKILNMIFAASTAFNLMEHIVSLIGYETRLAGRTLVSLIILSILMSGVLLSTWLCTLVLLYFYFTSLALSNMLTVFLLIVFNLLVLIMLACIAKSVKKDMFFPSTRAQLRMLTGSHRSLD